MCRCFLNGSFLIKKKSNVHFFLRNPTTGNISRNVIRQLPTVNLASLAKLKSELICWGVPEGLYRLFLLDYFIWYVDGGICLIEGYKTRSNFYSSSEFPRDFITTLENWMQCLCLFHVFYSSFMSLHVSYYWVLFVETTEENHCLTLSKVWWVFAKLIQNLPI